MKIALTVNGKPVNADVAPRTSLADFLREELLLTGTHLGCEHGICGACTVEIDGEIARSCITYAVTCDRAAVRTIEGFDADALMERLRFAFRREHALQCGYCTPGMLIAARDLVRRKQGLSRAEIRSEMSGNLCRCTGYMGIVSAIESVMQQQPAAQRPGTVRTWLGPAPGSGAATTGAPHANSATATAAPHATPVRSPHGTARGTMGTSRVQVTQGPVTETAGNVQFTQSFVLRHALQSVWHLMADVQTLARCMPGVVLDGPPDANGRVTGRINVKLGPIAASFAGEAEVKQYAADHRQLVQGRGGDRKSASRVSGSVDYRLTPVTGEGSGGEATRVDVTIGYALTGMLAQIGRSNLAQDLARRLGETFAHNIDALLSDPSGASLSQAPVSGVSLVLRTLAARVRALLAGLLGSRSSKP